MNDFEIHFINKCLKIIVMFFPILIWDILFMLQCIDIIPYSIFKIISLVCIYLLFVMILFGNSIIFIEYTKEDEFYISLRKSTSKEIIKNMVVGSIIITTLVTYASIPFYVYGIIQFGFMIFDKKHNTLTEKLYQKLQ